MGRTTHSYYTYYRYTVRIMIYVHVVEWVQWVECPIYAIQNVHVYKVAVEST